MNVKDFESGAETAVDMLRSLAHKGRLMILCQLAPGEKTVMAIAESLDLPQPSVSQHLATLRREGLIERRRDGRQMYYSLKDEKAARLIALLYDMFCPEGTDGK